MGSTTLRTALATWIDGNRPTVNLEYTTKSGLRTGTPGSCNTYLYFSRPFPLGVTITSAVLTFYTGAISQTTTDTISFKRLKQSISMTKVNYNTRPTALYPDAAKSVSMTGPLPAGQKWSVDVTTQMQSVANGDAWYGWQVAGTYATTAAYIYNSKWADPTLRPYLTITWSEKPTTPTNLAPSNGREVGTGFPYLQATYTDAGNDNPLTNIQVQRNATNTWTAPTFDSGAVPATVAELDTSTTSWPVLTTGTSCWWRIRCQDSAGKWSDYSVAAQFAYDDKGVVAITNPAAAPNNFVNEHTPPITWTFTGETQESWQVNVADPTTGRVLFSTGKITGTQTSYTLPPNVLTEQGQLYNLRVIVWDSDDRESIANSAAWADASLNFTFALSATTTPTLALTAVSQDPRPRVILTWTRATAPDYFTILRGTTVLASNLLPGDLLVSGTSYSWTDPAAATGTASTYQVLAVVNGKASSGNATATVTPTIQGIWLADTDRANEVVILGREDRAMTYGEDSEVITPLGASQVSVITHAQRGLEGTITGELQAGSALGLTPTATQWRDALLRIRRRPGQTCWLTVSGVGTIPVVIRNVSIKPKPIPTTVWLVSFEFYQVARPA